MIGTTSRPPQRFPLAACLLLAACSGGGGGGPNDARPVIVAASYVGAGPPAAADTLRLTFSEPISLVAGKALTDVDVLLSGNATLGAVTAVPTLETTNTLVITLGVGVTFVPGTTTISLLDPSGSAGNDVVLDASGQFGGAGTAVPIGTSDGASPVLTTITASAVDGELNGTGPAGGVLQVPARGWTIDLAYTDNGTMATSQSWVSANVTVATTAGPRAPGTNLVPFLTTVTSTNTDAAFVVPGTMTFPDGPVTLTAIVVDSSGRGSTPSTFAATVRAFDDTRQPFETDVNPTQVWFLDFSRDIESFTAAPISGGADVAVVAGANGRSDFEDVLRVLGLNHTAPIAGVVGGLDSNQVVVARLQQAMLDDLTALYAGARVTFTLTQPSGDFGSNSSVGYNSLGYSRIAIAGSSDTAGVLGIAIFDTHNETQNDNTRLDFGGTRLGIFLHTIVDAGLTSPGTSLFRQTYDQFVPVLGGTAIGADAADDDRLTGVLTDARATAIDTALTAFARFAAVVTAHECGHSMGLVQNGPMPTGLYGDDSVNFPGSSNGHIRNASLFPAGATNVMSPSLSFTTAIHPSTGFNSLNLAYLREQATYGN